MLGCWVKVVTRQQCVRRWNPGQLSSWSVMDETRMLFNLCQWPHIALNSLQCADVPLRNCSLTRIAALVHLSVGCGWIFHAKYLEEDGPRGIRDRSEKSQQCEEWSSKHMDPKSCCRGLSILVPEQSLNGIFSEHYYCCCWCSLSIMYVNVVWYIRWSVPYTIRSVGRVLISLP